MTPARRDSADDLSLTKRLSSCGSGLTLTHRFGVPVDWCRPWRRRGPADGVLDDALDVLVVVRGILLVAGTEVEDPTPPPPVTQTAPEDFPPSEPAHEDELVRLRNVEGLAVHLLFELYILADTLGYGMPRRDYPEPLGVVVAPLEVARRTHEPLEDPGEVARVEDDQAHAAEHPLVDLLDDLI